MTQGKRAREILVIRESPYGNHKQTFFSMLFDDFCKLQESNELIQCIHTGMTILGYPRPPKSGNQEIPWYRNGRSDFSSAFFSSSAFQAPRAAVPTLLGSLMTSSGHLDAGGRHTDPPGGEILSQKSAFRFCTMGFLGIPDFGIP